MAEARSEAFWQRLVAEVAGGKAVSDVAHRHGVSASSVLRWRDKLAGTSPSLVPVRITAAGPRQVELQVGIARVSFDEGTDPGYIAAVARALGA